MHRVLDGEGSDKILKVMARQGLVARAWYESGARSFDNSKKPIMEPADVEGMKVRVMNNELYSGMISARGGNPSPKAFAEICQSLKTGVVDGAGNNWPCYESIGHFAVAGYGSHSEHLIIPECVCINADIYAALSDEDAARESADLQRQLWGAGAKASQQKGIAAGVTVNEIPDKAAMKPVYDSYLADNPDIVPLVELIQSTE